MTSSIIALLPTYPPEPEILSSTKTFVSVGPQTPGGWPVLFDENTLLIVQDESAAQGISRLINEVANFLASGLLAQQGLSFITGSDAAYELEQALRHVGVHLTAKDLER